MMIIKVLIPVMARMVIPVFKIFSMYMWIMAMIAQIMVVFEEFSN